MLSSRDGPLRAHGPPYQGGFKLSDDGCGVRVHIIKYLSVIVGMSTNGRRNNILRFKPGIIGVGLMPRLMPQDIFCKTIL